MSLVMMNFSDKKPLVTTLDKYVKLVRTEHCFLLFEQLGKTDNWLQCLEVCFILLFYLQILQNFAFPFLGEPWNG